MNKTNEEFLKRFSLEELESIISLVKYYNHYEDKTGGSRYSELYEKAKKILNELKMAEEL